jgi:hypothetical protein
LLQHAENPDGHDEPRTWGEEEGSFDIDEQKFQISLSMSAVIVVMYLRAKGSEGMVPCPTEEE